MGNIVINASSGRMACYSAKKYLYPLILKIIILNGVANNFSQTKRATSSSRGGKCLRERNRIVGNDNGDTTSVVHSTTDQGDVMKRKV